MGQFLFWSGGRSIRTDDVSASSSPSSVVNDADKNVPQCNPSESEQSPIPVPKLSTESPEAPGLEHAEPATQSSIQNAPETISCDEWNAIIDEMQILDMTNDCMQNFTADISFMSDATSVDDTNMTLNNGTTAEPSMAYDNTTINTSTNVDASMAADTSLPADNRATINTSTNADASMAADTTSLPADNSTTNNTSTNADASMAADTSLPTNTSTTANPSMAAGGNRTSETESSRNPTPANHTENAETKKQKEYSKLKNAYKDALNHGAVKRVYTRVIIIGMPGVGKSTLLKTILKCDETSPASGHYSLVELNGSFTAMTTEQATKSLAIMIHKVSTSKFGRQPFLKCFVSKNAMKKLFAPNRSHVIKPREAQYTCLKEIAETLRNDTLNKSEIVTEEDKLSAQLQVTEGSFQDLAGEILPLLITVRSVFMLVFDASKCDTAVKEQICQWIADICKMVSSAISCNIFSIIDENLSADHPTSNELHPNTHESHPTTNGTIPEPLPTTHESHPTIPVLHPTTPEPHFTFVPTLIIIGTHGDRLNKEKKDELRSNIENLIKSRFQTDPIWYMVRHSVQITNLKCDSCHIANTAQICIRSLKIPVPLTWELFRSVFLEVTIKKKRGFLKLEETAALAIACGIDKTGDELQSVLRFCHEHGILLHFRDVKCMNEIVIADSKWLIKQFEKLHMLNFPECGFAENDQLLLLSKHGILMESVCSLVWPSEKDFPKIAEGMLHLMKTHHLAVALSKNDVNHAGLRYFVPCALQRHKSIPSDISVLTKSNCHMQLSAAPLCFTFSTKHVPHGCFAMVAASLMNKALCFKPDFYTDIWSNVMPFIYNEGCDDMCNVVLLATPTCISIYIGRQRCCTNYKASNFASACRNVFTTVYAILNDTLKYSFQSIATKPSFYCKCEQIPHPHFIEFNENTKYYGEKLMCQCREVTLSAEQQWWLRPTCEFEKNGDLSTKEIDEICLKIPSDLQEQLCNCLELELQNTKPVTPKEFTEALTVWATKMGNEARDHFLYHVRRLKWDTAAIKILLSSKSKLFKSSNRIECTKDDLLDIALLNFDWVRVGRRLLESEQNIADIDREQRDEANRREAMLMMWLMQMGSLATYKVLARIFEKLQYNDIALKVYEMERKKYC